MAKGGWRGRLEKLPLFVLLIIGLVVVVLTGSGGYAAYQAYDYVEHDNEFCFSCHLMQEPFEAFAQSAHRGLGCKACHQPSLVERSQMGVTGIVLNPDSLTVHAEVPNDLCASCHIEGDPERWRVVAASAGHRVHLESDDPALDGLQCVECHSSGIHQFTAVDETCAQSGCHTESTVQLGAMSDLTLHCVACHTFVEPTEDVVAAEAVLSPDASSCFACHAMREIATMPTPDPHEGSCGSCHNPHEQEDAGEAAGSCASVGCHQNPTDLTPHHAGLSTEVVTDCVSCHVAHDFALDGNDCMACHGDVFDDVGALGEAVGLEGALGLDDGGGLDSWGYPLPQEAGFSHGEHRDVSCLSCHDSSERHGAVLATSPEDCRSCHHEGAPPAGAEAVDFDPTDCRLCHDSGPHERGVLEVVRALSLSVGEVPARSLSFEHEAHADASCVQCHEEGPLRSAETVDCVACHVEHHEPTTDCMACHVAEAGGLHRVETAHVTCSGAGCHEAPPFESVPRERTVCLGCHQDMVDHEPGGDCVVCHALPSSGTHLGLGPLG